MRAIGLMEFGGPEVLGVVEVPDPVAGPGELAVRVHAATVNPTDTVLRSGGRAARLKDVPPPYVPGMDVAGTLEQVGTGTATDLHIGERVMAIVLPLGSHGGYAERVVVPAESVVRSPADATDAQAATLPMNGLTARMALDELALDPGETLAVSGAAGAVGGYAIQLAHAAGLRVVADAVPADQELVSALGADFVVRGDDFAAQVRHIQPQGADGLVDAALLENLAVGAVRDGGAMATLRGYEGTDIDASDRRGITFIPVYVRNYARRARQARRSTRASRVRRAHPPRGEDLPGGAGCRGTPPARSGRRAGPPGPRALSRRRGSPPAQIDVPALHDVVTNNQVQVFVIHDRRIDVRRQHAHAIADPDRLLRCKDDVLVRAVPDLSPLDRRVAVVHAQRLQAAVGHRPALGHRDHGGHHAQRVHERQAELGVGRVHQGVRARLDLGRPRVEVVRPGAARRDEVATHRVVRPHELRHRDLDHLDPLRPVLEPDDVPLVAHDPPHGEAGRPGPVRQTPGVLRTAAATRAARRSRRRAPLARPPRAAASTVASESTATVTRAPVRASAPSRLASATSLASNRSSPRPASAMPSISFTVAQVKAVLPRAAWRAASAVHLCALTCGRSRSPGSASAIVRRLASRAAASTTSAGVVSSEIFMSTEASDRPRREQRRSGYCPPVSTPWFGDACSLVDAFRAGEISPLEALDDCIAAIEKSPLNACSFTDFERAREAAASADVSLPFGGVPFGVKELEKVAGWPYSEASVVFKDRVAGHDDTSVVRLRRTGAVLAAQTTAPEFGGINCTSTVLHGTTRNPWHQGGRRVAHRAARRQRSLAASSQSQPGATAADPSAARPRSVGSSD